MKKTNLELLEEWNERNQENVSHHAHQLRIALAIEHLAQSVKDFVSIYDRTHVERVMTGVLDD